MLQTPILAVFVLLLSLGTTSAATAQPSLETVPNSGTAPSFAGIADLTLSAPIVVDAVIRSTARIKAAEAVGVAPGRQRVYVIADVTSLVRGAAGLPPRVGYLVDLAPDARGRIPNLKKTRVLLFARPVAGDGSQLQLVAPSAQLPWTPALDATVRGLVREALALGAAPAITGVGSAFHVPGALPGEGETQVFLQTADARPVSLSVLRRPGEQRRWSVALSEIVDEAAGPPAPRTLLWYRLACGLPATLPEASTAELDPAAAMAAREDYEFVRSALGPCGRSIAGTATPQTS